MAQQGYYPQRQNNRRYQQPAYTGPYNPQYAPQQPQYYQQQNAPKPKRSGAKYTEIRNGKAAGTGLMAINAWRVTKMGLQRAKCFPVDAGTVHTSQKGRESVRYAVEISNDTLGTSQTYWCLMSLDTKKIFIDELGLVISPNGSGMTASGKHATGFFGRKKNR